MTPLDSTKLLVSWVAPPCPNGPISGYAVLYRQANRTQSIEIRSSMYANISVDEDSRYVIIPSLVTGRNYTVHVRAFTNYNGAVLQGDADTELLTLLTASMEENGTVITLPERITSEDGGESRPAAIPMSDRIETVLFKREEFGDDVL